MKQPKPMDNAAATKRINDAQKPPADRIVDDILRTAEKVDGATHASDAWRSQNNT